MVYWPKEEPLFLNLGPQRISVEKAKKPTVSCSAKVKKMILEDTVYRVEFVNSGEQKDVTFSALAADAVDFLEHYGGAYLLDSDFAEIIGNGDGQTKFDRLLSATGYADNPQDFFLEITEKLGKANSANGNAITVGGIHLPNLFVLSILEKIIPENRFISIRDVGQFEKLANVVVAPSERDALQQVIETYPVRLSMHTIRQMRISKNVAYQYAPFIEELDPAGQVNTWIGQFHQGLLERMYRNRVIFLLNMSCPVYCRFCFRKHKDSRNQANPTAANVQRAVDYVGDSPNIKEIVITGGDPFLNKKNMLTAIDGLKEIPHVQTLRLATRSISYDPYLFYKDNDFWLNTLKMKSLDLQQRGKRLEVATHFIHPDEISLDCLDIISTLVNNGISVYVQTPFLNNCNDKGPELTRLFSLLRGAGAELHYIYIPCSPIQGNSVYWTPISKGLAATQYLRAHLSDRVMPRICTATPIGKIDWHSSGWAVEKDKQDDHFFWIRTPYTPDYFKNFAQKVDQLDVVRVNSEGTLDARFMAEIGDDSIFIGSRPAQSAPAKADETDQQALEALQALAIKDQKIGCSIVATESAGLCRAHETRVEIDAAVSDKDLEYLRRDDRITDVVISSQQDAIDHLYRIGQLIDYLRGIHHVNAVRLRSFKFNYDPAVYTRAVIDRLGELNRLAVVNPLRLEIETQFLHSAEIEPIHADLAKALRNKGITVYSNTPLLADINDNAEEIHRLAYRCRKIGLEFHHLYVAGLPLQKDWSQKHPLDVSTVIDIATKVRKDGSGREIPRYIILTELGEVDFGLTSKLSAKNGRLSLKLLPYSLAYFKGMDPAYDWPPHVKIDTDGKPIIALEGLTGSGGFIMA
jgi:KamA family protein